MRNGLWRSRPSVIRWLPPPNVSRAEIDRRVNPQQDLGGDGFMKHFLSIEGQTAEQLTLC
jgi:hypothetical protein